MVEYHALGPVTVTDEVDRELPVGGPRQRRLMAMLLIHRNGVVSVDRLAEAVFAGEPTPAASTTLRSYVARLRRVVDRNGDGDGRGPGSNGDGSSLLTQSPGYKLEVPDDAFDVARFEGLLAKGRAALDRDDAVSAASLLRDAIALWQGEPYAEFADEDWVRAESQRLHELLLVAHERLADAELACGRTSEVVSELERLVAEHPLRDAFLERLMLALYRAGRQADALRAYQDHRAVLAEELGLEPAPALAELERRILEHDRSLHLTEPAGRPLRGYRIGERLGTGREGTVHAARLPNVERELAIRVYRQEVADRPDFVRSFEADAQRVASIRHDAIVPLHDYWREPGAAYLVMRRMTGGTLRDRLHHGPFARDDVTALVTRIGGALEAAAAEGVHHGRLAPSCVLFDDRGVAYLSDFTVGTPAADPDRDGHDFATLVAACLTGSVAVGAARGDLPAPLRDLLAADRPPIGEVVARLLQALTGAEAPPDRVVNPYKGLRAFDEPDAANFFGRGRIVDELLDRLRHDDLLGRLVVVVGGSGSGKSSLVRAGLLPRVRAGEITGSASWYVTTLLPGGAPFKELAESLRRVAVVDDDDASVLTNALQSDESGIDRVLRRLVPDGQQLLLVIDQFEELFTLTPDDERRAFLDGLMYAVAASDSRLRVVATLRADCYDRPLQLHRFGAALRDATVTVPAMSASELETAVIGPAARAGITVDPAVAVELVAAVVDQPAALPSLQFTLFELVERCSAPAITRADYEALGGIEVAIAARAEELYRTLDDDARVSVRRMFERLVVVSPDGEPTRRRARCSEITSMQTGAATDDIEAWVQARLLTLDRHRDTREPTVEVAHEALLREWPRLRGWIDEDREAIVALGHLRESATSWVELNRDTGALYRGARLEHVVDVIDDRVGTLPPLEHEFLDASRATRDAERRAETQRIKRQARTNRRLRFLVAVIAAGLVVTMVLGFVAVDQRNRANGQRRVAGARELASASVANLEGDPELAVLLALEAVERTRRGDGSAVHEAEEALHRAVGASRVVLRVPDVGGWVDWSPDGNSFVTEGPEDSGMIDIRDARTGDSLRTWRGHDVDINLVAYNHDGTMLATTGDDSRLRVWDPASGDELLSYEAPGPAFALGASFSPDGKRVAAGFSDGVIRVIDLGTGEVLVTTTLPHAAFATEFSPDGTRLAVGSINAPVAVIVDTRTGEEVFRLEGHKWPVNQATWSPDGTWIATVSGDGTARLWDARTGAPRFTLEGHSGPVNAADWSPDSRRLVTGSMDGTARVWRITDQGAVEQLALSSVETRNGIVGVAFSPDGRRVLAGVFATTATVVWDVTIDGSAESAALPTVEQLLGVGEFSPDGAHLVATGPDRTVTVWETENWRETVRIGPASGPVTSLAVSADSRWLATGSWDGAVDVWDLTTGEHRSTIPVPFADDVAWSPDGDVLAIANGAALSVFDGSGKERAVLRGEPGVLFTSVRFDATGSLLVSTQSWSERPDFSYLGVRVWDWARGESVRKIETPAENAVFAPDGESILASNMERGRAEIFDAASGEMVATLSGHTGVVLDVEFSPDGSLIATSGTDATVRIWDGASGAPRVVLRGHESGVGSVTFSPDGSKVASISADGIVRVWALDRDDLVEIAERKVTRTLTDVECRRYLHVDACGST